MPQFQFMCRVVEHDIVQCACSLDVVNDPLFDRSPFLWTRFPDLFMHQTSVLVLDIPDKDARCQAAGRSGRLELSRSGWKIHELAKCSSS